MAVVLSLAAVLASFSSFLGIGQDQSHSYMVALRLLDGQTLYQDFFIKHGPLAGWAFLPFLWIAPTGGIAYMLASAALNMAGAAIAYCFVWRLTESRKYGLYAGVLTAVWFVPVFGAFYHDHLAYLLVLLAGYAYLFFKSPHIRLAVPALLLAAAYYVKQTIGPTGLLAFGATLLVCEGWRSLSMRDLLGFASWYLAGHAFLLLLISAAGSFEGYWHSNVTMPLAYAGVSEDKSPWELLYSTVFPFKIQPLRMLLELGVGRLVFYPVVLGVYASYVLFVRNWIRRPSDANRSEGESHTLRFGFMFLIVSTLWCSALLGRLFAHVTFGFGCIVAVSLYLLTDEGRRKMPSSIRPEILVVGFYVLLGLAYMAHERRVWEAHEKEFPRQTDLYPVMVKRGDHPYLDVRSLAPAVEFLQAREAPYALMDDEAFLIPLALRRPPVSPTLVYHIPLTIPQDPRLRAEWEREFIEKIEARGVRFFVSTLGPGVREFRISGAKMMEALPGITRYLEEEYDLALKTGAVKVFGKKDF